MRGLKAATVDEADLRKVLGMFDPVWDALFPHEKLRVLQLLIERVDYDAEDGRVSLTFRPTGIRVLAAEVAGAAYRPLLLRHSAPARRPAPVAMLKIFPALASLSANECRLKRWTAQRATTSGTGLMRNRGTSMP